MDQEAFRRTNFANQNRERKHAIPVSALVVIGVVAIFLYFGYVLWKDSQPTPSEQEELKQREWEDRREMDKLRHPLRKDR